MHLNSKKGQWCLQYQKKLPAGYQQTTSYQPQSHVAVKETKTSKHNNYNPLSARVAQLPSTLLDSTQSSNDNNNLALDASTQDSSLNNQDEFPQPNDTDNQPTHPLINDTIHTKHETAAFTFTNHQKMAAKLVSMLDSWGVPESGFQDIAS